MALENKNQRSGDNRGSKRNEIVNGGIEGCLRKYNAANCGANWKVKNKKGRRPLNFNIKSKN